MNIRDFLVYYFWPEQDREQFEIDQLCYKDDLRLILCKLPERGV